MRHPFIVDMIYAFQAANKVIESSDLRKIRTNCPKEPSNGQRRRAEWQRDRKTDKHTHRKGEREEKQKYHTQTIIVIYRTENFILVNGK